MVHVNNCGLLSSVHKNFLLPYELMTSNILKIVPVLFASVNLFLHRERHQRTRQIIFPNCNFRFSLSIHFWGKLGLWILLGFSLISILGKIAHRKCFFATYFSDHYLKSMQNIHISVRSCAQYANKTN